MALKCTKLKSKNLSTNSLGDFFEVFGTSSASGSLPAVING